MTFRKGSFRVTPATAAGLAIAMAVACGSPGENGSALRGDIIIDGSSTVFPISAAAAEDFRLIHSRVRVSVGISGTGGGFKKFCAGETDISDASRPITPSEQEVCAEAGIEFIEIPIAYDGLAVLVNPQNDWVTCITVEELKTIWGPEAEDTITSWSQVRNGFPDEQMVLFGPGTDSGTFDYFTDAIAGDEGASRGDFQASEDDNVLVQGIAGNKAAIGYFGLAYYSENTDKLKLLEVDDGTGCVAPSTATVRDGTYQPLARPIYIYVEAEAARRPELAAFIEFYLSAEFRPVIESREVGYVELADGIYEVLTKRFQNGVTGTLWPEGAEVGASLDRYR